MGIHIQSQNDFQRDFLEVREEYLHRGLAREGLPDDGLGECGHPATWRCLTCHGIPSLCAACCRARHISHPLHRVEFWTGEYYHPGWLRDLGVQIHAGHRGQPCPSLGTYPAGSMPQPEYAAPPPDDSETEPPYMAGEEGPDIDDEDAEMDFRPDDETLVTSVAELPRFGDPIYTAMPLADYRMVQGDRMMVVVDLDGVHEMSVTFCCCPDAPRDDLQLIDLGYYPASIHRPRTIFTERVLDDFLLANKECKTAARNYYNKLRRTTNDAFPHMVPVG